MTRQQILDEINHLPPAEQRALLEILARTLREELQTRPRPAKWRALRGLLKSAGDAIPSELRVQSLLHKHA